MIEPDKSLYVRSGDADIYCEVYGVGNTETLILLHGNGENLHCFGAQIDHFSSYLTVIAIDTRGHGRSTRGEVYLDFYVLAEDVLNVLDALQIRKAHVMGFSDGGITALHMPLRAPERFFSMILAGANYTPNGFRFRDAVSVRLIYARLSVLACFSKKYKAKKEIWGLMIRHPNLTTEQLSGIAVPVLIVTGENDVIKAGHTNEMKKAIPGAKHITVPNADHFLCYDRPDVFNKIADEFIRRILDARYRTQEERKDLKDNNLSL